METSGPDRLWRMMNERITYGASVNPRRHFSGWILRTVESGFNADIKLMSTRVP